MHWRYNFSLSHLHHSNKMHFCVVDSVRATHTRQTAPSVYCLLFFFFLDCRPWKSSGEDWVQNDNNRSSSAFCLVYDLFSMMLSTWGKSGHWFHCRRGRATPSTAVCRGHAPCPNATGQTAVHSRRCFMFLG